MHFVSFKMMFALYRWSGTHLMRTKYSLLDFEQIIMSSK